MNVNDIIKEVAQDMLNENTYKVYHGTNSKFGKFNIKDSTQGVVWFTDSTASIESGEHGGNGNKFIMTRYITINKPAGWNEYDKYSFYELQHMGYDGVILPHGTEYNDYIVFSNNSISAKEPQSISEIVDEEIMTTVANIPNFGERLTSIS